MTTSRFRPLLIALAVLTTITVLTGPAHAADPSRRPNIVFILADDLGYGDLSCFGQKKFQTPNLDALAVGGMKFTNHYSGSNVCAPSRCVLMTGKHTGHTPIRDNRQAKGFPEGQEPVPEGALAFPLGLKKLGYTLGAFGKWGLGPVGSTGDPLKQGFDRFYGYNCQAVAHNYYPTYLWDNDKKVELKNPKFAAHQKFPADADAKDEKAYARYTGPDFAPDLIAEQAREFLKANKEKPFFLYFPTTVPHLALQVPEDSLKEFAGKFPDEPYLGQKSYLPQFRPRAAYAAMVTRFDREVGRLVALVKELGLEENTIFVMTSDNGPLYGNLGGTDADFFNSSGGFKGRKGSFDEGGFHVPCIVRWKGKIAPGTTSDRVTGFEDWFPTLFDLAGASDQVPTGIDGISFAATLLGKTQDPRPFLYRESPGYGGQQCVRVGDWKAIRKNLNPNAKSKDRDPGPLELYDLKTDPAETKDLASANPEVVKKLEAILTREHQPSKSFPIPALDRK